jgi:acetyltransferase-like isoleucine patch superfamily enzyme
MGLRRLLHAVIGALATALAVALRAAGAPARPLARFWRLARLRSRVEGVVPVSTQFDGSVETAGRLRLELGEHCRLGRRVFLETCDGGVIRVGPHTRINTGCFIVSYAEISIGRDCLIGEYVSLCDADHGLATDRPIRQQPHRASAIRVGDGAWIGRGAVILKGVTIGPGAVVAANSVVTKDVPPMTIVAGSPARALRTREAVAPPPSPA